MAKLAVLLFAAFAFQAVLAGPFDYEGQQDSHVRVLKKKILEVSHDAIDAIQTVQPHDRQGAYALASQANEYAHDVHTAVYHLHQLILRTHSGEVQQVLDQVAHVLSDIAHAVEQAVTDEPLQLKNVLKNNVLNVNYQIERLSQVAQHQQQQAEHDDDIHRKIEHILEELLDAAHQLQNHSKIQHETHYDTKGNVQEISNRISMVLQRVNTYDDKTVHALGHQAHELSHLLDHIVHHLFRQVHYQGSQINEVFEQVSHKFSDISSTLEQLVKTHEQTNVQGRINELKSELKTAVHSVASQIDRLIHAVQTESQDVSNIYKYIVSDVCTGLQHLYRNLEQIAQHQYHEEY